MERTAAGVHVCRVGGCPTVKKRKLLVFRLSFQIHLNDEFIMQVSQRKNTYICMQSTGTLRGSQCIVKRLDPGAAAEKILVSVSKRTQHASS
jgi:hypothetical protein